MPRGQVGIIGDFEEVSWYRAVHGAAVSGTSVGLTACLLECIGHEPETLSLFQGGDLFAPVSSVGQCKEWLVKSVSTIQSEAKNIMMLLSQCTSGRSASLRKSGLV